MRRVLLPGHAPDLPPAAQVGEVQCAEQGAHRGGLYGGGMDAPGDLMVGPRGRRLCLELAALLAPDAADGAGAEYLRAALSAAFDLDPGAGTSRVKMGLWSGESQGGELTSSPDDVARLLDALRLDQLTGQVLFSALTAAADSARYWQEPDGEDVLAGTLPMRRALARVAASVASSGLATWWATPLERTMQWSVAFIDPGRPIPPAAGAVDERLPGWRAKTEQEELRAQRDRPADVRAPWSGTWWSTPPHGLTVTTRRIGAQGPLGLWLVEDAMNWHRASVCPVMVPPAPHVFEIDGPDAWSQLCRRYPLEVTASRRHDWYRTTGQADRWVVPDWSLVANDVDGVHLTVAGYLATAGRAVAVTDDTSSVLAGWNPDETYWLTDVAPFIDEARPWLRGEDDAWREDLP